MGVDMFAKPCSFKLHRFWHYQRLFLNVLRIKLFETFWQPSFVSTIGGFNLDEKKWFDVRANLVNLANREDINFCIMSTEIDCYYNQPVFEYSVRLTTVGLLTKEHLKKVVEIADTYDLNISIENINGRQNIVFS